MLSLLYLIIAGMGVGMLAPIFGVGGGIVAVPMLYLAFPQLSPQSVICISLSMISMNSWLNTRKFKNAGKIPDRTLGLTLSLSMAIGVFIGGLATFGLDKNSIKLIFATTLLFLAGKTLLLKKQQEGGHRLDLLNRKKIIQIAAAGVFSGVISGLTGLGGGAILVPLLIFIFHIPLNWVPVYSNQAMAFGTLIGAVILAISPGGDAGLDGIVFQFHYGRFYPVIVLALVFFSQVVAQKTVLWVDHIPPEVSKRLFALMLLGVSLKIFYQLYI